jgi:hypothetical protein
LEMNKKRKLMKLPHPDKFIHENLRDLGLNVELAAAAVGVRATTLIDLLTEEELSPETVLEKPRLRASARSADAERSSGR